MSIKRRLACTVIAFSFVMILHIPARSDEGRDRDAPCQARGGRVRYSASLARGYRVPARHSAPVRADRPPPAACR